MGKINDKMENITSGWFFLHWFQHDISMVSRNKQIGCFTHKPIRVSLVSLDKNTIFSRYFHQNLKKNVWTFYTCDRQMLIAGHYFEHWDPKFHVENLNPNYTSGDSVIIWAQVQSIFLPGFSALFLT